MTNRRCAVIRHTTMILLQIVRLSIHLFYKTTTARSNPVHGKSVLIRLFPERLLRELSFQLRHDIPLQYCCHRCIHHLQWKGKTTISPFPKNAATPLMHFLLHLPPFENATREISSLFSNNHRHDWAEQHWPHFASLYSANKGHSC